MPILPDVESSRLHAGQDQTLVERVLDNSPGGAVLYRAAGIEPLRLGKDLGLALGPICKCDQGQQGGVANQRGHALVKFYSFYIWN